ncbi:outer membrane lipoprotein-sorting protein [Treponema zioleckii]|jgi:outer membrane lipoprotein-sorting protein|uniref:outer membrane lipoprotein-sorting protein n=1 Tax=Treponema zioleckii TaxID=331680 RepID=UPI00168B9A28|nr:outer membrane lipoprotein-sorting protein [Treponema zioleckii]
MKLIKTITTVAATFVMAASAFAIDGTQIMTKVYDRQKPDFSKAAVQVTLSKNGKVEETRNVGEYGRSKNGLADVVMVFLSPASVKDTRFLQKENNGKDDDKWIYLPSLKSTRRVAASDGSKAFVGTDFSYDDMSSRKVEEDTHELLKESEDKGNFKDLYVVKSTPKDPKSSQYSYRISWITKDAWIPTYIELYDKKGKLVKVNEIRSIKKMPGTNGRVYNVPMENVMKNVQTGHTTAMKMINVTVDQPVPDRTFTTDFLSTGK